MENKSWYEGKRQFFEILFEVFCSQTDSPTQICQLIIIRAFCLLCSGTKLGPGPISPEGGSLGVFEIPQTNFGIGVSSNQGAPFSTIHFPIHLSLANL
jgi:hypothetical protein